MFKGLADKLKGQKEPNPEMVGMLKTMNVIGYNMYAGTADPEKVRRRRAKNKVGAQQRRVNRGK